MPDTTTSEIQDLEGADKNGQMLNEGFKIPLHPAHSITISFKISHEIFCVFLLYSCQPGVMVIKCTYIGEGSILSPEPPIATLIRHFCDKSTPTGISIPMRWSPNVVVKIPRFSLYWNVFIFDIAACPDCCRE